MATKLFQNVGVNSVSGPWIKPDTDLFTVFAWGNFGGAKIRIQFSPDGIEWFDDPTDELWFYEKSIRTQRVSVGIHVRAAITDVNVSTNVSLWIF